MKYVIGSRRRRHAKPLSTRRIMFENQIASILLMLLMFALAFSVIMTNEQCRGWIRKSITSAKHLVYNSKTVFNRYELEKIYHYGIPGTKFQNKLKNTESEDISAITT